MISYSSKIMLNIIYMVLHGTVWYCMVLHGIVWYCMVLTKCKTRFYSQGMILNGFQKNHFSE